MDRGVMSWTAECKSESFGKIGKNSARGKLDFFQGSGDTGRSTCNGAGLARNPRKGFFDHESHELNESRRPIEEGGSWRCSAEFSQIQLQRLRRATDSARLMRCFGPQSGPYVVREVQRARTRGSSRLSA